MRPLRGSPATQSLWIWALLFLAVAVTLGLRQPSALLKPMFPKEDGAIFFKDAYEKPWTAALFSYYAGYMTLPARIVAVVCTALPLTWVPTAYAGSALVMAAGAMCFFYLPHFRPVIANDVVRGAVVLAMPLMPNAEAVMRLSAVLWYTLFVLILTTLLSLPAHKAGRWLLWIVAVLAAWSNPVSIVCVPVLVLRCARAETRGHRWWWASLAAATLAYALTAEHVHSALGSLWEKPGWPLWLLNALSLRVFCFFFLGDTLARCLLLSGWGPIVQLGLLLAAGCVVVVSIRQRRAGGTTGLTLLYFVLVLPMMIALRPEWLADFGTLGAPAWAWHGRYFYLSVLLLCLLAGIACELGWRTPAQPFVAGGFFLGWLSLHALSFHLNGWQAQPGWNHYARAIRAAEASTARTEVTAVRIVLADVNFSFDLAVKGRHGGPPTSVP